MGGPKRPTIKKLERRERRLKEKEEAEKKRGPSKPEKVTGGVIMPRINKELTSQIRKMKAITPSGVANTFGLRVSVAKDLLETLESKGVVKLVSGNSHIRIYKFTS